MYFYLGYINIIYENLAGIHIVETADKVYYCCFAGTGRAYNREGLTRIGSKINLIKNRMTVT